MKNCDYCGIEIERRIFCSNSHKVMFHQKVKVPNGKGELVVEEVNRATSESKQPLQKLKRLPESVCYCRTCQTGTTNGTTHKK